MALGRKPSTAVERSVSVLPVSEQERAQARSEDARASLEHPGGTVRWTIESPAVPGYYWWRPRGSKQPEPSGQEKVIRHPMFGMCILERMTYKSVDTYAREWAGPLADAIE
jgi:hypothetical protein